MNGNLGWEFTSALGATAPRCEEQATIDATSRTPE